MWKRLLLKKQDELLPRKWSSYKSLPQNKKYRIAIDIW